MIKSRNMIRAKHVARMRDKRIVYRIHARKSEEKRQLGSPRHRSEDNIKMDIREI
jgi:hypothetical protein